MNVKNLKVLFTLCSLSLQLSIFSTVAEAKAKGGADGGGGYQYRDTAYPNLKKAQNSLLESLSVISQEELNQVTRDAGQIPLDKTKLSEIIKNLKYAPLENRTNMIDGFEQPKDLDYSIEGQYIFALQPLFESINTEKLDNNQAKTLRRKIVHEATHLFKIGLDDDDESFELSKELINFFETQRPICGMEGTIEQRLQDCSKYEEYNAANDKNRNTYYRLLPALGPVVNYVYKKGNIQIHDSRSLYGVFTLVVGTYNEDPVKYCSKADNLNGQISWSVATFEQVNQIDKENAYYNESILLANQKVRTVKLSPLGRLGSKSTLESIYKAELGLRNLIICVGTLN